MQERYWMYQRSNGVFYVEDRASGKQESLKTRDKIVARGLVEARNQAAAQPVLNIAMAKAYLVNKSPEMATRKWDAVLQEIEDGYANGPTLGRWQKARRSEPFKVLAKLPILHTESDHFLQVLRHSRAGNSTQKWLRIVHNRALDLGWLLAPVLSRRSWPKIIERHAIALTHAQHQAVLAGESDAEHRLYYQMLWLTGSSQTDGANLHRGHIDVTQRRITYQRQKLARSGHGAAAVAIGFDLECLLKELPEDGYLFPSVQRRSETDRASRFRKLCLRVGLPNGVSLHSYRYAWAGRAKAAGMPIREAMAHLGHESRAIHLTYSAQAEFVILPLEHYEAEKRQKIVQFDATAGGDAAAIAAG